jgi:release factor glutamine methyltransferase
MRLIRLPGVFRPRSDTWMLARALRSEIEAGRRTVLDVCTGSGALALVAASERAEATAIDVSRRSVATVKLNAALRRLRVDARRGDLFAAVAGERFDAIVSNPPYVPAATDALPSRGRARAWDAGRDGRALLDRICAGAAQHLNPGGVVLLVHSSLLGYEPTADALAGLEVDIAASARGPLGPLMRARRAEGLIPPVDYEDVLVVRARNTAATIAAQSI